METPFNLEERTYLFALNCRKYTSKLPKSISNTEDSKQLVRSSDSVAANYIEGNEKLGEKDLLFRLRISRKEAKESKLWLNSLNDMNTNDLEFSKKLINEAEEIRRILSAMINKLDK